MTFTVSCLMPSFPLEINCSDCSWHLELSLFSPFHVLMLKTIKICLKINCIKHCYASPSSGEAYRDRRLTTNFELWVDIFVCRHVSIMRIPKPRLSVCPHPKKRNHHSFVNISPTLAIDTSMERSSRVLQHGNPDIWIFFKQVRNSNFYLNFDLC